MKKTMKNVAPLLLILGFVAVVKGLGEDGWHRPGTGLQKVDTAREYGRQSKSLSRELVAAKRSTCWTRIWDQLAEICSKLDDAGRKQLGISMAACHLGDAGITLPPQHREEGGGGGGDDINRYLSLLANHSLFFETYTKYFLNGISLCFVQQTERLKQVVNQEVAHLLNSAFVTSRLLEQIESRIDVAQLELGGADETFARFFANFEWLKAKMNDLENVLGLVGNNLDSFKGAVFYSALAGSSMLATSGARTASARFWFLCGFFSAVGTEILLHQRERLLSLLAETLNMLQLDGGLGISPQDRGPAASHEEAVQARWVIRSLLVGYLVLALLFAWVRWTDLPKANRSLIKRMLEEVAASRQRMYMPSRQGRNLFASKKETPLQQEWH